MEVLLIKKVTKCILRLFAACFAVELAAFPIAQTEQGALCWVFPFTLSLCFLLPVPGHPGAWGKRGRARGEDPWGPAWQRCLSLEGFLPQVKDWSYCQWEPGRIFGGSFAVLFTPVKWGREQDKFGGEILGSFTVCLPAILKQAATCFLKMGKKKPRMCY